MNKCRLHSVHLFRTGAAVSLLPVKWGLPVFWVCDGVDDGVVDGRGLGDDGGDRVHVGCQHVCVPVNQNTPVNVGLAGLNEHRFRQSSPAAPFTLGLYPGTKQLCVTHGSNLNLSHLLMAPPPPPPHPLPPSLKQLASAPFLFEAS